MFQALRSLAVLLLLIATAAVAAEIKPFAREDMASDAVRLTETLRVATASIGAEVKGKTPDQLRKEAAAEFGLRRRREARGRCDHGRSQGSGQLARLCRRRDQSRRCEGG